MDTIIKTLSGHKYAQAHVIIDNNGISLISYRTLIINIDNDGWLTCTGLYSRTTIKHIGWFMKTYGRGYCYYDVKRAYNKNIIFNLYTGEEKSISDTVKIIKACRERRRNNIA